MGFGSTCIYMKQQMPMASHVMYKAATGGTLWRARGPHAVRLQVACGTWRSNACLLRPARHHHHRRNTELSEQHALTTMPSMRSVMHDRPPLPIARPAPPAPASVPLPLLSLS